MNKNQKAARIQELLNRYFPDPQIPLHHRDPFTFLIAVLLSAQCSDKIVNQVTPALFQLADTPQKMALCSPVEIERLLRPLGLAKTKTKHIIALSQKIVTEFDGKVPSSFAGLESLPGIGHKSASVVMVQVFGKAAFPVDTHIHRLANRWGLSSGVSVVQTEKDLKKLFAKEDWGKLHLQIIYFARKFCKARSHKKELCPICKEVAIRGQSLV